MSTRVRTPFPKPAITRWDTPNDSVDRVMFLTEEFSYIDPDGNSWDVPEGTWINGATIPRALWSIVGSPYAGDYRLASIVHDFFVGEGPNPDVTAAERKAADCMFYYACMDGGCSKYFAGMLYIAVRIGWWFGQFASEFDEREKVEWIRDDRKDDYVRSRFRDIIKDADVAIKAGDLDAIDQVLDRQLTRSKWAMP